MTSFPSRALSGANIWKKTSPRWKCKLNADDLHRLAEVFPHGAVSGQRYTEQMMKAVNQ